MRPLFAVILPVVAASLALALPALADTPLTGSGQADSGQTEAEITAAANDAAKAAAQEQIDSTQTQIDKLKAEIAQLQSQLTTTTEQKQTLQATITALNLQITKLQKTITLTSAQISQTNTQIGKLAGTIQTTAQKIASAEEGVASSLRELEALDEEPAFVALFSSGTLSSFFDQSVALGSVRSQLGNKIEDLSSLKSNLETHKQAAQTKASQLKSLKTDLSQQQQGLSVVKQSQNQLLTETKNKESAYQSLLAQKRAEEAKFEADLIRLAAGLASADTSSAPSPERGILGWPLKSIGITQYFGNTAFAQAGAYNGKGHNGIDFRASIGTPVLAVLEGTVQETNQGAVKNCQYGKWVLVKHDNGLTSLYAHLSSIAVSKGERVGAGDTLGYSGDTGYATGPHLHLTLYISSAVSFKQYTCFNGASAFIPIAPLNAYLNPLLYLPTL